MNLSKKLTAIAIALVLTVSLVGCGSKATNEEQVTEETTTKQEIVAEEPVAEETTKKETTKSESDADWREFLSEYEDWVDEYIEIVQKYKDNPTDMSILSDYTEMMSELAEWSEKADEMELSITDTDEALEYSQEVLRIADKLAKVAE